MVLMDVKINYEIHSAICFFGKQKAIDDKSADDAVKKRRVNILVEPEVKVTTKRIKNLAVPKARVTSKRSISEKRLNFGS